MLVKSLAKKIVATMAKVAVIASLAVGTLVGTNLSVVHADTVSGQAIVDTAAQYIGKVPYVWGGNNIEGNNVGADCSGFICRIYEKFGYNFWPSRTALRKYGENLGTDISVAKLGDIIWYDGHVAIYAGLNEKGEPTIIHETGGKYQNVVWTPHRYVGAALKGVIRIPGIDGDGNVGAANNSVSISNTSADSITQSNAVVRAVCNKTSGAWVDECGLYLGTNAQYMPLVARECVGSGANKKNGGCSFDIWYDLNGETCASIVAGTTYYYQFYCISGGQQYYSDINYFTAAGTLAEKSGAVEISEGWYTLTPECATVRRLDVSGGATDDCTNMQIWGENGTDAQKFYIKPVGNKYYEINTFAGKSLDVEGVIAADGRNIIQYSTHGGNNQKWYFVNAGNGYYNIVSAIGDGNYVMDVNGAGTEDATNVQLWSKNNSSAQRWKLVSLDSKKETKKEATVNVGTGYRLKMRKSASSFSKCICTIKNGAKVTLKPEKNVGSWSYIEISKYKGYVPTKYLK